MDVGAFGCLVVYSFVTNKLKLINSQTYTLFASIVL